MRVLALDAALGPCSVALIEDGVLRAQAMSSEPRGAIAALPGLVAGVLAEAGAGFDEVVVTVGPGSFTGVRAALALGHGLALGAGVPIVGVTSVAALAAAWTPRAGTTLWVAIDSRRGRVFLGRDGIVDVVGLDEMPAAGGTTVVAGDADAAVAARTGAGLAGIDRIEARYAAKAAEQPANRGLAQPLYMEPPAARAKPGRPAPA